MSFFQRFGLGTPAVPAPPANPAASAAPPTPVSFVGTVSSAPGATASAGVRPLPSPTDPASLLAERNQLITANAQFQDQLTQANAAVATLTGQLAEATASIATLTTERDTARAEAGKTVEQVRNQQLATLAASQGIPPQQVPPVDPTAPAATDGSAFRDGLAATTNPLAASEFILKALNIPY